MDTFPQSRRTIISAGVVAGAAALSRVAAAQTSPQQPGALTTAPVSQSGLSPRLTMHAIDTFHGTPGAGMKCDLSVLDGDKYRLLKFGWLCGALMGCRLKGAMQATRLLAKRGQ